MNGSDITGHAPMRVIRFFPDWGRKYPLWESETPEYATRPEDYGLSTELAFRLEKWLKHWALHFDYDSGWDSSESKSASNKEGNKLIQDLSREVSDFARVIDERNV